ncbi:DUF1203 domain-containing protein [Dactylosporangium matsuzakiense]|uniref:DUF1203 domain-containing protein n=1 Tax=Dactylosporangium matsuzakiense TaxID=53360 RepID=A0A9W6KEB6_9ACTN|nr:DUF1203 domain-containing protein [Dactylosporangium matsuzakiense]UWZ47077.1 DUF1203 domain-containing protein [Dactylosporangium matsuzakiense]GLK98489.1 hypothetical protein GCM10017581_002300 [Dactylosporangium matsuzakiense]
MFTVHAIDAEALDSVRRSRKDVSGNAPEPWVAEGGEPLRCCLRDARPGEHMLLFGYEPALPAGTPYREIGAVFAHTEPCAGPDGPGYPADWRTRPQVLRAYDARGWIHPSTRVHDGTDPVGALEAVLAHPEVVRVDSRNVAYGCYMFTVTR